jgi:hypothetical protein
MQWKKASFCFSSLNCSSHTGLSIMTWLSFRDCLPLPGQYVARRVFSGSLTSVAGLELLEAYRESSRCVALRRAANCRIRRLSQAATYLKCLMMKDSSTNFGPSVGNIYSTAATLRHIVPPCWLSCHRYRTMSTSDWYERQHTSYLVTVNKTPGIVTMYRERLKTPQVLSTINCLLNDHYTTHFPNKLDDD